MLSDITAAFATAKTSLQAKIEKLAEDVKTVQARHRADTESALKGESSKLTLLVSEEKTFITRAGELKESKSVKDLDELFVIGKDVLSKALDSQKGASVTDQSIYRAHTARYEKEFLKDMSDLGVRPAHSLVRVTEYVPEIITYVQKIIANGFGYEYNNSVYFDVNAFRQSHNYGKLAPHAVGNETLAAEGEGSLAGASSGKRSSSDFALWKASKPGEPFWESPWGNGRPGWHIECSAMCSDVLGQNIDVHGGGEDLKFPHHDNELAQCEAHSLSQQWVNHFWHAGHLNIQGLKMSKSLKNFISIGNVLKHHSARRLRILFLLQPWDKQMNYSDQSLEEAAAKETTLKHFFGTVKSIRRAPRSDTAPEKWTQVDRELHAQLEAVRAEVRVALEDNFDYPRVMHSLFALIGYTNSVLSSQPQPTILVKVATYADKILRMFGVMTDQDFGFQSGGAGNKEEVIGSYMDAFAAFRTAIRQAAIAGSDSKAILSLCDDVRENIMPELGVMLQDTGGQSVWKLDDPAVLIANRDAKKREVLGKLSKKVVAKQKEITKWADAAADPVQLFQGPDSKAKEYSDFDEKGMPQLEAGKPLAKSAGKKLQKLLKAQEKANKNLKEKLTKNPNFIETLDTELNVLEANFAAKAGKTHAQWLVDEN